MKVYAESQPPKSPGFLHLGYLAATLDREHTPVGFVEGGIALAIAGALLAMRLRGRRTDASAPLLMRIQRGVLILAAGIALGAGLLLSLSHYLIQAQRHAERLHVTMLNEERLAKLETIAKMQFHGTHCLQPLKPGVYNLGLLLTNLSHSERYLVRDARGNPFKLVVSDTNMVIESTGEDGISHTSDDLHSPVTLTEDR